MPKIGESLTIKDISEIIQAFEARRVNFPEETDEFTWTVVMLNIGDRYSEVECMHGEWKGIKKDIAKGEGIPTCPNGHVLSQKSIVQLGWVSSTTGE